MSGAETLPAAPSLPDGVEIASISPAPTEGERAAIEVALATLWSQIRPQPTVVTTPAAAPRWRYAGRPWRRRPRYGGWA